MHQSRPVYNRQKKSVNDGKEIKRNKSPQHDRGIPRERILVTNWGGGGNKCKINWFSIFFYQLIVFSQSRLRK